MSPDSRSRLIRILPLLIAPALLVLALAIILTSYIDTWTSERATANAADSAAFVADVAIQPLLADSDFVGGELNADRIAELDADFASILNDDILGVKIWDADGRVLYSDDRSEVGEVFSISDELESSLAGDVSSEVEEPDEGDRFSQAGVELLLEVYAPISVGEDSEVDGSFELYLPYDPIAAETMTDTRAIQVILAVTLFLLYLALTLISYQWWRSDRRAKAHRHDANHDELTGLANRRKFRAELAAVASTDPELGVAVLFLDLDDFKIVNDQHGHPVGDALLVAVADRLCSTVRSGDTLARLGGDEFAVLLPGLTDLECATNIAERCITSLQKPFQICEVSVSIQVSIGIDIATADRIDPDIMQRNADAAMYVAKRAGKGRFVTSGDSEAEIDLIPHVLP